MKSFRPIALGVTLALSLGVAQAAARIGEPAPGFSLSGADGKTHALSGYRGKVVVLEWTNHECPFVKKHYQSGNMQSLQKAFTANDVVWLSVITGKKGKQGVVSAEKARELTAARGAAPTAVLFDPSGDVGRAYGAKTTPHMYIIGQDGRLLYAGGIDSIDSSDANDIPRATPYLKRALDEVLAGKPVSTPTTKPYGCSVKYD
jgi:peroxiredoxin